MAKTSTEREGNGEGEKCRRQGKRKKRVDGRDSQGQLEGEQVTFVVSSVCSGNRERYLQGFAAAFGVFSVFTAAFGGFQTVFRRFFRRF